MTDQDLSFQPAPLPRALDLITRGLLSLAVVLMLLIVVLIVAQIAARNLWNQGLPRAEEVSRLAGVLCVYLTAPYLALRGQHVAVDVFVNLMPRLTQKISLMLAELSVFVFSALIIWGGYLYLLRAWKFRTPALGMQNIWLYAPVVFSFVLLGVIALWRMSAIVKNQEPAA